jgi:hypothetical protein
MGETCDECGTRVRSSVALMSHRGSRPCRLAKTKREMASRGWAMCMTVDAEKVLVLCDIEYEKAPGEFAAAGMRRVVGGGGATKNYFDRGSLDAAYWCPAWAVPLVNEARLDPIYRARIINTISGDAKKLDALHTAVALAADGGLDVLRAYAEQQETT